jgi:hypothetical protein
MVKGVEASGQFAPLAASGLESTVDYRVATTPRVFFTLVGFSRTFSYASQSGLTPAQL